MTYTDHLSPTRANISRAWQFAGVCCSSAGRLIAAADERFRLLIVTKSNLHSSRDRHHGYLRDWICRQRASAAAGAFGLALTGFGQYSLDGWLGIAGRWSASFTWIALIAGIVGGFANLALRRRPAIAVLHATQTAADLPAR
jgi:hypothetical protein